jgi:hypothetical protein
MSNNLPVPNGHPNPPMPHRSYDPLRSASSEAPTFNRLWLKNGESLRPLQRIGFGLFSVGFLCAAEFCAETWWQALKERDPMFIAWFAGAFFFFIFGILGLINTLRSNRPKRTR